MRHFRDHSQLLIHAATLEYLRRGGRIGRAASLVGGVFDIKPLITRRRRHARRLRQGARAEEGAGGDAGFVEERSRAGGRALLLLIDAVNDEEPPLIREMIERVRPNAHFTFLGHVGAVVGTHIGPGTAAFAMIVE